MKYIGWENGRVVETEATPGGGEPPEIATIPGLQDALDAKQAAGDYAAAVHDHDADYSAIGHDHAGTYQPAGAYALANHAHPEYAAAVHTQGYSSGGGAVNQQTSKSTGVTLNTLCGRVTMNAAALAAAAEVSFVVTNSQMAVTDVVILNQQGGGTPGNHLAWISAKANGSFTVSVTNLHTASLSIALVLDFAIIKSTITP